MSICRIFLPTRISSLTAVSPVRCQSSPISKSSSERRPLTVFYCTALLTDDMTLTMTSTCDVTQVCYCTATTPVDWMLTSCQFRWFRDTLNFDSASAQAQLLWSMT